ncbi:MAG: serine hydroxymethyltransferase [Methanosarcinaceae archaeon]|nr:serine hydroxymethyltransferase [Methanosarcinaceae archaeon]NKQ39450.1 serine hydroxymethyltransferase [Methanosarcinales archaeon]
MKYVSKIDPEIAEVMKLEKIRQNKKLGLIASENHVSYAVMEAQGSMLTNKYAEGYSGKRYYGGCEVVDIAEDLAIKRAKEIFGAEHVNVQPHSGSSANLAVYLSVLKPGDTIMSMDLEHGGHLSHGSEFSFVGQLFNIVSYGVNKDTMMLDYSNLMDIAKECKPQMIVVGASSYPRKIDFEKFKEIANEVGAYLTADIAHIAGLVAAGVHQNPVPYVDFVTTTTHKSLRGPRGGMILCKSKYARKVNDAVFPGLQGGPLMHAIAAKAVALKEAQSDEFKADQLQTVKNCKALSDSLIDFGFKIVSNGTDNHLLLIDLSEYDISGIDAEILISKTGIVVNKNSIPFDKRDSFTTSGIRLGTPAVTTRGMKESEMKEIAGFINTIFKNMDNKSVLEEVKKEVEKLCDKFPAY